MGRKRARRRRTRRLWTAKATARLVRDYPNVATWRIARAVKRPLGYVYAKANRLGLKKSPEYLASPDACRLRRGGNVGAAYRFKKGQVPANKGMRRPGWAPGRMKETQFKKGQRNGQAARHYMPLGAERLVDGYLYVKVAEVQNVPYTVNWKPVNVLNWERANGRPLPDGHVLRFRDGNHMNVAVANLELITRRENALRNSLHRLPEPLKRAIYAKGALNRRINRMEDKRGKDA
jgi:hypothetical protein